MPRPTCGRLSRRAGGAHNVVPPTARRSACLPSCWPTCLQRCFRTARCICNGSFCMRSSYATTRTTADAVRQRRSASSSRAPAASSVDETAPPVDSGKSSNRRKPPPRPPGVLGQQASARGTSRGKSEPPSTLGSICELGRCSHAKQNQGKRQPPRSLRSPSGRRTGETQAADAGAQRAAHRHNVRHPPAAAEGRGPT